VGLPDWLFEAPGTLYFSLIGYSVRFFFKITKKKKPLLIKIQDFFGYGTIQKEKESIYCFQIS